MTSKVRDRRGKSRPDPASATDTPHRKRRRHPYIGIVAKDWTNEVARARAALTVAAMRNTLLTYKELGTAIGMSGVELRNTLPRVLDELSKECNQAGEPSLAALVVNADTGKPGAGWSDGVRPWHTEVRRAFVHHGT